MLIRIYSFALLLIVLAPNSATASSPNMACSVKITIRGDAQSFWIWGTDSWTGEGVIECFKKSDNPWTTQTDLISLPVYARYEGWGPGYGATGSSEVQLALEGFVLTDITQIYGSYRTLGATAKISKVGGQFALLTQNSINSLIWLVTPTSRAVNTSAFLQFGQLILQPYPKEE